MELSDKVAIVTGGGSGIGRATALQLAREGARVVVADYDETAGAEAVQAIAAAGGEAAFLRTDVANERDVEALVAHAEERFGRLDILHNNAGVLTGPRFPDSPPRYWNRAIDINVRGVLNGIYYAVPALRRAGGGAIVTTASVSGLTPHLIDPVYAATKAAVVNLTRSLVFLEKEDGIRINCVCPGLVRTPLAAHSAERFDQDDRENFEARRAGMSELPALVPDDIAAAVLKLIKDDTINGKAYWIVLGQEDELR